MRHMTASQPTIDRLHFTGDDEADRLLASEPLALLIGFALDQQVSVQKAFSGPAELRRRIGHLDAARIAAMDPEALATAFRQRPALHRFPGAMAGRVQALAPTWSPTTEAMRAASGPMHATGATCRRACSRCRPSAT